VLHLGRLLALLANIRLGWKDLPGTNTLAYYGNPYFTAVISFMILAPGCIDLKIVAANNKTGQLTHFLKKINTPDFTCFCGSS
jgi:hypothetical protein